MKWGRAIILTLFVSLTLFTLQGEGVRAEAVPPAHSAAAVALFELSSGRILYGKNLDERRRIASLTKVMTAIVAIEAGQLDEKVTTSANAYGTEGSSIYLKLNEELTLEEMLYGLMLRSGNDAAVAIAEHIGGSVEGFAVLMNQKAQELGMRDTQFRNPHGLDDSDEHYSTARDLALLTTYAMANETFRQIVGTTKKEAPLAGESYHRLWTNKNRMLYLYDGATGVKTGYTKRAGRCLISSAEREELALGVVTLEASNDWQDHTALLNYGFRNFQRYQLLDPETDLTQLPLQNHFLVPAKARVKSSFHFPLLADEVKELSYHYIPLEQGEGRATFGQVGLLQVKLKGRLIGQLAVWQGEEGGSSQDVSVQTDGWVEHWWRSLFRVTFVTVGGRT